MDLDPTPQRSSFLVSVCCINELVYIAGCQRLCLSMHTKYLYLRSKCLLHRDLVSIAVTGACTYYYSIYTIGSLFKENRYIRDLNVLLIIFDTCC